MSADLAIAINVVGIVAALTILANAVRESSGLMLVFGYLCLGVNVFLLIGNVS